MDTVTKHNTKVIWASIAVLIVAILIGVTYLWSSMHQLPSNTQTQSTATSSTSSAQASSVTIDIISCNNISPTSVIISPGEMLVLRNGDSVSHSIGIAGQTVTVAAYGSAQLQTGFISSAGSYPYTCDGRPTSNEVVLSAAQEDSSTSTLGYTFKSLYDGETASIQSCMKSALGADFNGVYANSAYVLSSTEAKNISSCLSSSVVINPITLKVVYDAASSAVQECLRSALASDFDQAYSDPNYVPSAMVSANVSLCFAPAKVNPFSTFKSVYDNEPAAIELCVKSALGSSFNAAYGGLPYTVSSDQLEEFNACSLPN